VVRGELLRRQEKAAFSQPKAVNVRSSALSVGQRVRALIGKKWLSGIVNGVCAEPNSYVVKLSDGRLFRRTRWAINISSVDSNLNPVRPCVPRPKIGNGVAGTEVVEQAGALPMAGTGTVTNPTPAVPANGLRDEPIPETDVGPHQFPVLNPAHPCRPAGSRIPVADRYQWVPITSLSVQQPDPSPGRGVTRSGHSYAKLDQ
jgi:hypothetical protein